MGEDADYAAGVDGRAVMELTARWRAAAVAGEVGVYLQFVADDAVFLAPNLEPFAGKAAISDFVRNVLTTFKFRESMHNRPAIVSGELGYVWGTYEAEFTNTESGSTVRELGNHAFVWRRDAPGVWKLAMAIWNSRPPRPR